MLSSSIPFQCRRWRPPAMPVQRKRSPRTDPAGAAQLGDIAAQAAAPARRRDDLGSSSSQAALSRLNDAIAGLRAMRVAPILLEAVAAIRAGDGEGASKLALDALQIDERNGHGWHVLAIARELCADYRSAIAAYESALALLP